MECWIFGAGERGALRSRPAAGDLVIAADGGFAYAASLGIEPTLVVGDFDSMPRPQTQAELISLPCEKDDTDMLYAVKRAMKRGATMCHLYGGTGGRADHTFANVQTLLWMRRRGIDGRLYWPAMTAAVVENGTLILPPGCGYLSVFSLGDHAEGVCLRGLKYELEDAVLSNDMPLGVSNERIGVPAEICVRRGTLLVTWEEPGAPAMGLANGFSGGRESNGRPSEHPDPAQREL